MKFTAISPENGVVGGENVSTEKQKTEQAPNPWRGGRGETNPPKKRRKQKEKNVTQSCSPVGMDKIPRSPQAPSARGSAGQHRQSCAPIECPDYPDHHPILNGRIEVVV